MVTRNRDLELETALTAAARLQEILPDAVLGGGSPAAYHTGHRISLDEP